MNENVESRKNIVIITGVSASGKTTLQDALIKLGFNRAYNATTRTPRGDDELDDYIFLTKEQFFEKLSKGDFLEHTNYGGNWYGIPKHLPEGDTVLVLDPVGREQALEKIAKGFIDANVIPIYLDITKKLQDSRLKDRGTEWKEREERKKDFDWFFPSSNSIILDGSLDVSLLADEVCRICRNSKET